MTSVLNNKPASQTLISWHAAETFGELSSFSCCFSSPLYRMSAVTFATDAIIISSSGSRCILTRWLSVCLSTIVFEHWNECPAIKASPCRMIQNKSNELCDVLLPLCAPFYRPVSFALTVAFSVSLLTGGCFLYLWEALNYQMKGQSTSFFNDKNWAVTKLWFAYIEKTEN